MSGWPTVAAGLFALSVAECVYVYAGYPALLLALSRWRARPVRRGPVRPRLSVIVAAFDEENVIADKIRDTFANGYPPDRLEMVVASDGSTDRTVEMAHAVGDPRVRVLELPRRGKALALNEAVRHATGDVLVFTDADTVLGPDALVRLVEPLADPRVGGVAGRKAHAAGSGAVAGGEGMYARFDEWQKGLESEFGSVVAAHGALYAIRRELFVPVSDPSGADDMAISMRVVTQGRRLVYESAAVAVVEAPVDAGAEFGRKVRIANQVMRALFDLGPALWTSGFYTVQLLSHKLLRYLVPFFLLIAVASNAALATLPSALWRGLLVAQLLFYALAAAGAMLHEQRGTRGFGRLLSVPYYFCLVNTAAFVAVLSVLRGQRSGTWASRGGFQPDPP